MKTFTFTRWSARETTVGAAQVEFTAAGGLVFRGQRGEIILAVHSGDWNNLREIKS